MTGQKHILAFLLVVLTLPLYAQRNLQDTVFIRKDSILGSAQSIFYSNHRDDKLYDAISRFEFGLFDDESYKISTEYFSLHRLRLKRHTPVISITRWVALEEYKGQYYAYYPCDFYTHFMASINDTTYIDWTGEGPVANVILSQEKIDDTTYMFSLSGIYDKERTLTIHIIDIKKGIAVFEETSKGSGGKHYLMIAADKIRSVPLIVNNCETQKQTELTFDTPNFDKLLGRGKKRPAGMRE
jgi:hypothetical protein